MPVMNRFRNNVAFISLAVVCFVQHFAWAGFVNADDTAKRDSPSIVLAGRWEPCDEIDRKLGYSNARRRSGGIDITRPHLIEITVDDNLGKSIEKLKAGDLQSYREYVEREKHQLIATGRIRLAYGNDNVTESECLVTHSNGRTYLWYGVVGVGMLPAQASLVSGADGELDLLFVDFAPYARNSERPQSIASYQRSKQ